MKEVWISKILVANDKKNGKNPEYTRWQKMTKKKNFMYWICSPILAELGFMSDIPNDISPAILLREKKCWRDSMSSIRWGLILLDYEQKTTPSNTKWNPKMSRKKISIPTSSSLKCLVVPTIGIDPSTPPIRNITNELSEFFCNYTTIITTKSYRKQCLSPTQRSNKD